MQKFVAWFRSWWSGLRRPSQLDAEMNEEMRFHIEMEANRLMQQRGLDRDEAYRQAAIAFGGIEKYRGAGRDALGLTWLRGLDTDLRLGMRMLRKNPGLTVIGVLALSLAIGAGAAYLEFVNDLYRPALPFANGDRLVGIVNRDLQSGAVEDRVTWDFVSWRDSLKAIDDIGAYQVMDRNLITDDGRSELVKGVEITPSTFRMLRVPPALGRPLIESDASQGAASVAVIGYDLWQARFGGDTGVIGRTIKLGAATHSIVGVMPRGFGFPIYQDLWVPLKIQDAAVSPRAGAPIKVFGMLAANKRLSDAQAEITAIGLRTSTANPQTHQHLRPEIKPYVTSLWLAQPDGEIGRTILYAANIFFIGLLGVCGANMATLVFARTATRANEINVRTALGASRARIAGQLFAEALVLCSLAAGVGLLVAYYGLIWVKRSVFVAQGIRPMFWWNDQLSPETIAYAIALAIGGALIIGVLPAWKATGTHVQESLKQSKVLASGLKFGGMWTGVIVTQVGLTVVFLCIVGALGWGVLSGTSGVRQLSFPGDQYLSVRLGADGDATADAAFRGHFRDTFEELRRRLLAEPGVRAVTFASSLPGTSGGELHVQVDGITEQNGPAGGPRIRTSSIDVNLPQAFGLPILSGRTFSAGDAGDNRNVAIVDQTFVRSVMNGRDPVGSQVRRVAEEGQPAGPWLEIIGVVQDMTRDANKSSEDAFLYRPIAAGAVFPLNVAVRLSGDATTIGARLRTIAADVDPTLRIDQARTLAQVASMDRIAIDFFVRIGAGIAVIALMLAMAGVYALLSFTVARRTPDIAIRLALGANAGRVVLSTFARALLQVGLGVVVGCIPGAAIVASIDPEVLSGSQSNVAIVTGVTVLAFMALVTVGACYAPAKRALRIQPADALKST